MIARLRPEPVPDDPRFPLLRDRFVAMILGREPAPTHPAIDGLVAGLDAHVSAIVGDTRDSPAEEPAAIAQTAQRLRLLAIALRWPRSRFFGQDQLLARAEETMRSLLDGPYAAGREKTGNWWHWEIGIPLHLLDAALLLGEDLEKDLSARLVAACRHFAPDPRILNGHAVSTAANRVWCCAVAVRCAILASDAGHLRRARLALYPALRYVTTGDGLYRDGSFIQHRSFAYSGGYGIDYLRHSAEIIHLLDEGSWRIPEGAWSSLRRALTSGFAPLVHGSGIMDMVRGREASRPLVTATVAGRGLIATALWLAQAAPPAQARLLRAFACRWITDGGVENVIRHDPSRLAHQITPGTAALAVSAMRGRPTAHPVSQHVQYPCMDRVVHRGPGFSFGLAMHSMRTANFESINGENLRGWFSAYGQTHLYGPPTEPAEENLAPTIDAHRLPGTTVSTWADGTGPKAARRGSSWVGGAALEDVGFAAMHLYAEDGRLAARKSWLMVGSEILALGSSIKGRMGSTVETIIANQIVRPDISCVIGQADGRIARIEAGPAMLHEGVDWIHLAGTGGYFLPGAPALHVLRERRTGSWRNETRDPAAPDTQLEREYCTAWIDHGADPDDASYAYILLPGASAERTANRARADDGFRILEASGQAHVAEHAVAQVTAAAIWRVPAWRSTTTAGPFSASAPCAVIMRRSTGMLRLGVCDPTHKLAAPLALTVRATAGAVLSCDKRMAASLTQDTIELTVDLRQTLGSTLMASFRLRG
ncbi:polysaccharide lyase 8 family protein [Roseomonas sp. WA12]